MAKIKTAAELTGRPEGEKYVVVPLDEPCNEDFPYRIDGEPLCGSVRGVPDEQLPLWRADASDPELIAMIDGEMKRRGLRCLICKHSYHGVVESREFAVTELVAVPPSDKGCTGVCEDGRRCCCDGKTQRFLVRADTYEEAERLADVIGKAGYEIYRFGANSDAIAIHPIDEAGNKAKYLLVTAFSDKLPPVSSYEEFKQRVGL